MLNIDFEHATIEGLDLRLTSIRVALNRIKARVKQGGHDVPKRDVMRRFDRSWRNFEHAYRPLADRDQQALLRAIDAFLSGTNEKSPFARGAVFPSSH